jgi:hypothetical protein
MSMSFRVIAFRVVPAVTLIVLGAGGITAGTAAAGTAAAPHRPRIAQPPSIDHQLCYSGSGGGFSLPTWVRLVNQFTPSGQRLAVNSSATTMLLCNPVQKALPSGQVFPITNPDAHLACFQLNPAVPVPYPTVVVTNQFGSATLISSAPYVLCVPSWTSLIGPPGMTPTTPPGLDDLACYPVNVTSGGYAPPPVTLQDEWTPAPVPATVNPVPVVLCLPTEVILPSGQTIPVSNSSQQLLCFPVTKTPVIRPDWDENLFGTSSITVGSTKWLCVPSTDS